jgi:hypothetical protein
VELVIGTKTWSTWSLRPWLVLKRTGAPFTETLIQLREVETSTAEILKHSPSGLVPGAQGRRPDDLGFPGHQRIPGRAVSRGQPLAEGSRGPRPGPRRCLRDAQRLRLPARRMPDGPGPADRGRAVAGDPGQPAPADGVVVRPATAVGRALPAGRVVHRRRLLHAGRHAHPQLRAFISATMATSARPAAMSSGCWKPRTSSPGSGTPWSPDHGPAPAS